MPIQIQTLLMTIHLAFYICRCHSVTLDRSTHTHSGVCDADNYSASAGGGTPVNLSGYINSPLGELLGKGAESYW